MKIGPYEATAELGRGGMGVVYQARDPDGRDVALKVLNTPSEDAAARFDREIRLLGMFTAADGFVPLIDSGRTEKGPYLVMPLLRGGTLRARLKGRPLPHGEVRGLANALASALANAHARGVVHRDLKPENILFTSEGVPLIADLGLAKHYSSEASGYGRSVQLTSGAGAKGTIGYMAPEQFEDASRVGPASDVFSAGAILYECLSGRPAFAGETVTEVMSAVLQGHHEPLARLAPGAPASLVAAIERALSSKSAQRFIDGGELGAALRVGEAPPPRRRRGTRHDSIEADDDDDEDEPSRSRTPLVLGVIALLAVVGGGAAFLTRGSAPPPPVPAPAPAPSPAPSPPTPAPVVAPPAAPSPPPAPPPAASTEETFVAEIVQRARANLDSARTPEDMEAVIDSLDRALARLPGDRGATELRPKAVAKLAELYIHRSVETREHGDLQGSVAAATRAIELDATNSFAWQSRGNSKLGLRDLEGALADLDRAVELDPNDWKAWGSRGTIRLGAGDLEGAEKDLEKSVALEPRSHEGWQELGMIALRRGDAAGAIPRLDKAVALMPDDPTILGARALARRRSGDDAGALEDAKAALVMNMPPSLRRNLEGLVAEIEKARGTKK